MPSPPPPPPPRRNVPKKTVMRSLGEFFGHIVKGIRTDVKPAEGTRQEVRRESHEEVRDTPEGPVILRRTIIEEVELPPGGRPDAANFASGRGGAAPMHERPVEGGSTQPKERDHRPEEREGEKPPPPAASGV